MFDHQTNRIDPARSIRCVTVATLLVLVLISVLAAGCTGTPNDGAIALPTPSFHTEQPITSRPPTVSLDDQDRDAITDDGAITLPTPFLQTEQPITSTPPTMSTDDQDRDAITEIAVLSSPGMGPGGFDPTKPAQQIRAQRDGTNYHILIEINAPTCYRIGQATLTPTEWQTLLDIVIQQHLLDFQPVPPSSQAPDYGEEGFTIVGQRSNRQRWTGPLANAAAPHTLMRHLEAVAKQKFDAAPPPCVSPTPTP